MNGLLTPVLSEEEPDEPDADEGLDDLDRSDRESSCGNGADLEEEEEAGFSDARHTRPNGEKPRKGPAVNVEEEDVDAQTGLSSSSREPRKPFWQNYISRPF